MTALQTLDLSANDLDDISDDDIFSPPENLSHLFLGKNHFTHLPLEKIIAMPKLEVLDLKFNNLNNFGNNFMKIIANGTIVYYNGNPLNCDCNVRPVRRWLATLTQVPPEWSDITCTGPSHVAGRLLAEVSEELMTCDKNHSQTAPEFQITPDIKFRKVE